MLSFTYLLHFKEFEYIFFYTKSNQFQKILFFICVLSFTGGGRTDNSKHDVDPNASSDLKEKVGYYFAISYLLWRTCLKMYTKFY